MAKKRIHNPKTSKYYEIRQRTGSDGKKGQIKGVFRKKAAASISRKYGSTIKRLAKT